MSSETPETPTLLGEISQGPSAFEQFLDRNQKGLIVVAILIALGTAAYVVFSGIETSREHTAGAALIKADSIEAIEALIAEHAGTNAADSATLLLAEQQWAADKQDEAVATLEAFVAANPNHPAAPTAKASLAAKWMAQGKTSEAVAAFQQLVDDPQTRFLAPYALVCIGDIAKAAGDTTKAKEAYTRISAEFPESNYINTANTRLSTLEASAPVVVDPPAAEEKPAESPTPAVEPQPTPEATDDETPAAAPESSEAPAKSDS